MTVFGVFYTPDFNEQLLSLHITKEGAKKAMMEHFQYYEEESELEILDRAEASDAVVRELEVK